MRVCVTGATGCVGTNVVSALRARGDAVTALVRRTSSTEALYRAGCTLVEGEVTDRASVLRAAHGCDAMVHAAARVGDRGAGTDAGRLTARATETVVRAARDAGVRRVIHVSGTAVYGAATEAERVACEVGTDSGMTVVVVRPCLVYGPHDRVFLPRLAASLRGRRFVWVVDPETPLNLVHASNVVDVVLRAMEHPGVHGEAFNVSDGPPLSLREVLEIVSRHLQVPYPRARVPTALAMGATRAVEALWRFTRRDDPPVTVAALAALAALAHAEVISTEKARTVLGYRPVVTTAEGLAQACDALT